MRFRRNREKRTLRWQPLQISPSRAGRNRRAAGRQKKEQVSGGSLDDPGKDGQGSDTGDEAGKDGQGSGTGDEADDPGEKPDDGKKPEKVTVSASVRLTLHGRA